jgi:hypothetical protein
LIAANWITDFNIRTGPDGVHRGFSDGVVAGTTKHISWSATALVARWQLWRPGALPPTVGTSRIGSRLMSRIDLGRIAGVVHYGMLRAGDEAFEAAYRSRGLWQKTARLEYGNDIIPSLPPPRSGSLPSATSGRHFTARTAVNSRIRSRRGTIQMIGSSWPSWRS